MGFFNNVENNLVERYLKEYDLENIPEEYKETIRKKVSFLSGHTAKDNVI